MLDLKQLAASAGQGGNMQGIYLITNLINGKQYVGQSIDLETRFHRHELASRKEDKDNMAILYAIEKYGIHNFSFDIIHEEDEPKRRTWLEAFYINSFNSWVPSKGGDGYNIADPLQPGAHSSKPLVAIHKKTLKFYKEFDSARQASRETGISYKAISVALKRTRGSGDYYWFFVDEYNPNWKPKIHGLSKPVGKFKEDLLLATFTSATKAAKELGVNTGSITRVCTGERPHTHGFVYKYI